MSTDQIKYIYLNWDNLKWEKENYENFVRYIFRIDISALDSELQNIVKELQNRVKSDNNITPKEEIKPTRTATSKPKKKSIIPILIATLVILASFLGYYIFNVLTKNNNKNSDILFSINDTINIKNNFFEYKNYKYEYNPDPSLGYNYAFIWLGTLTNISNETQKINIHVKFYDENKNCIGDYQNQETKEINKDDKNWELWAIEPNETKNPSFTIYDNNLYEGKILNDIKYISIEDIKY